MTERKVRSGADYQWVQKSGGSAAAHAVTPKLPSTDERTYLVCGKSMRTDRVVAPREGASRCGSCLRNIEQGTGAS
jgi:hypothetical protein